MFVQVLSELFSLFSIFDGLVQSCLSDTGSLSSDAEPAYVEASHSILEAGSDLTEDVVFVDTDILQDDITGCSSDQAHFFFFFTDTHTG